MKSFRLFRFLLASLSLSLFSLGCSSTRAKPDFTRVEFVKITMEAQIKHDFARLVEPASEEFCERVGQSFSVLQHELSEAKKTFATAMEKLAEDNDGYWQRKDGKAAFEAKVQSVYEAHLQEPSRLALDRFYDAYAIHVRELEERLLLQPRVMAKLSREQPVPSEQFNRSEIPKQGTVAVKFLDDGLGLVPFVGDAYDLFKAFVFDKRLEGVKTRAKSYALKAGGKYEQAIIDSLEPHMPKPKGVETDCRNAFSAAQATQLISIPPANNR